jgi:hypothetical protein
MSLHVGCSNMQGPDKLPHPINLKLSIAMQEQCFVVESLLSLD